MSLLLISTWNSRMIVFFFMVTTPHLPTPPCSAPQPLPWWGTCMVRSCPGHISSNLCNMIWILYLYSWHVSLHAFAHLETNALKAMSDLCCFLKTPLHRQRDPGLSVSDPVHQHWNLALLGNVFQSSFLIITRGGSHHHSCHLNRQGMNWNLLGQSGYCSVPVDVTAVRQSKYCWQVN